MSEQEHIAQPGVQEAATPWSAPAVLPARPTERPVDWNAAVDRAFARFPKTMARLAE